MNKKPELTEQTAIAIREVAEAIENLAEAVRWFGADQPIRVVTEDEKAKS